MLFADFVGAEPELFAELPDFAQVAIVGAFTATGEVEVVGRFLIERSWEGMFDVG